MMATRVFAGVGENTQVSRLAPLFGASINDNLWKNARERILLGSKIVGVFVAK